MLNISSVEDAYQYALKVEDKFKRKIQGNARGKEKHDNLEKAKVSAKGDSKPIDQKRTYGSGFIGNFFRYGEEGHRSFECLMVGNFFCE